MKRLSSKTLKEENYIEALAMITTRVLKFKTYEGRMNELDRIYEILLKYDDEEEQRERIYTAIYFALEREEF